MASSAAEPGAVLRDLGDGLVLRQGRQEDAEPLAEFNAVVNSLTGEPDEETYYWTLDMMSGDLPNLDPSDFTVVEDSGSGEIVSTLNLISQTWSYDGVEFGVGRIEMVGTDPTYRRRGLVRAQVEVVHRWSAERGEKVQGITGIPWYYRQFGYEFALHHLGGRAGYVDEVQRLAEGKVEPYRIRTAKVDDVPFLTRTYQQGNRRFLVSCVRDEEMWRYELLSRSEKASHKFVICVIETAAGEPVGLLVHSQHLGAGEISSSVYELVPGVSWLAVTPSVIRYLEKTGKRSTQRETAASNSADTRCRWAPSIRPTMPAATCCGAPTVLTHGMCACRMWRISCDTSRLCWSGAWKTRWRYATRAN